MTVNIQITEDLLKPLEGFPAALNQAMMRANNRTAEWSRTRTLKAITSQLNVKKSDLDGKHRFGGVTITRGTLANTTARLKITGKRIPIYRFSGRPKKPPSTKTGVSYQILTTGGRKGLITNAFAVRTRSGHIGFFKRVPSARHKKIEGIFRGKNGKIRRSIWESLSIQEMFGPSIPNVAEHDPDFKKMLEVDAGERLQLQFKREVSFILTGSSKLASDDAGIGSGGEA